MIPLFDLHCDTLLKLFYKNLTFENNSLHINFNNSSIFSPYIQVLAIWSDNCLDNEEAFRQYKQVLAYAKRLNINFTKSFSNLKSSSYILAVEDARLLNGQIDRLNELYSDGVRILTLNWQDTSIIGGGWNTHIPLSDFGKEVLFKCFELGIIVDLSHSSYEASRYVMDLCLHIGKPLMFSHSNAFSVCNHGRNVTDDLFLDAIKANSIVGLSLVPQHLKADNATIDDILKHIYHFLSLGGENIIALGCDFDGVSNLPHPILSLKDLKLLYNKIEFMFGRDIAQKIFFFNAYKFFIENTK